MPGSDSLDVLDADAYLDRIDADPEGVVDADYDTLARLQHAHVQHVPFENLAIVGHPHREFDADAAGANDEGREGTRFLGDGVVLDTEYLFEKIVERERGGYCFELNGLFHALLASLGYDVDRIAARVVSNSGDATPPANHHSNVVHLHRSFVVDVGTGTPQVRQPVPLDGTEVTDDAGVSWRVTESDRADATHQTEYREPHERDWTTRYVFTTTPRDLSYFDATNDHLQSSPDSTFTGSPIVTIATPDGYRRLKADTHTLVRFHELDASDDAPDGTDAQGRDGTPDGTDAQGRDDAGAPGCDSHVRVEKRTRERPVPESDWDAVLESTYGIDFEG